MTLKQKTAAKKALENGGKISTAMREAGYSPATAKTPQKLTQSKAWEEILEKYFPDSLLLDKGLEGLDATRASNAAILVQQDGTTIKAEEQGLIEVPDYQTRHKYLETALKLKKRLGVEANGSSVAVQVNNIQLDKYLEDVPNAENQL